MQRYSTFRAGALLVAVAYLGLMEARADDQKPAEPAPAPAPSATPEAGAAKEADDVKDNGALAEAAVLTPEEKAEKEARKACKVEICTAFRNPKSAGRDDITCNVIKSWRKEQLVKLVARMKVTWPYGPIRCTSALKLKRNELTKAMTEEKFESQLDKHAVSCEVDREKEPKAEIKFEFTPKVTFQNGKAVAARMNWGKVEAPTLIKGAFWTATAADNTVNMLSGTLVEDINDFITKKCDEIKDDLAPK